MATSVLMTVGVEFYKLHEFIDEAEMMGVSKRIPITAIPEGLVKGESRLFVAHPHAIVKVTAEGASLLDLAVALQNEEGSQFTLEEDDEVLSNPFWTGKELHPGDEVPSRMLDIAIALSRVPDRRRNALIRDLGLEFCMGVIGWAPLDEVQYVARKDEDGLPAALAHMEGYVTPVRVFYEEGDEDDDDTEED